MPRFYGKTYDAEGNFPVAYVSIKLIGPPDFFVGSNHKGEFSIDVPAGTYKVSVRHTLYRPITETITISTDTYREYAMERVVV